MLDPITPGGTDHLLDLARQVQATGYAFTTTTPATHARVNARAAPARTLRDVFGWSRPFQPDILPPAILAALQAADALQPGPEGHRSRLRLSTLDGLLFLHSAYPTTAENAVFFGPDTYRFAQAIAHLPLAPGFTHVRRAVDIGCGAGPGAILIARAHPAAAVFGADINPDALRLTRANAALAGVLVQPVQSDILAAIPGTFDLIVANPPYMADPLARAYRDGGGPLGAALSLKILDSAMERLAPGGTLLLYTGAAVVNGQDPFHDAAAARLARSEFNWSYREIDPDVFGEELGNPAYAHADRIAAVALTVKKPG